MVEAYSVCVAGGGGGGVKIFDPKGNVLTKKIPLSQNNIKKKWGEGGGVLLLIHSRFDPCLSFSVKHMGPDHLQVEIRVALPIQYFLFISVELHTFIQLSF